MRTTSLSKALSSLVSKNLSKSIHFLTAFVYLFTFLGPSLAMASHVLTETISDERRVTRTQTSTSTARDTSSTQPEDYKRFDLKIERDISTGGISFNLQDFGGSRSLFGRVTQNDFRDSPFKALMTEELHTGFSVDVPEVGQIQCDWEGNLKLVGLHKTNPDMPFLALNLVTSGTIDFSNVTFENLSVKATSATFVKGISLQGPSVFDVEAFHRHRQVNLCWPQRGLCPKF